MVVVQSLLFTDMKYHTESESIDEMVKQKIDSMIDEYS